MTKKKPASSRLIVKWSDPLRWLDFHERIQFSKPCLYVWLTSRGYARYVGKHDDKNVDLSTYISNQFEGTRQSPAAACWDENLSYRPSVSYGVVTRESNGRTVSGGALEDVESVEIAALLKGHALRRGYSSPDTASNELCNVSKLYSRSRKALGRKVRVYNRNIPDLKNMYAHITATPSFWTERNPTTVPDRHWLRRVIRELLASD